jgi:hypothetical protein
MISNSSSEVDRMAQGAKRICFWKDMLSYISHSSTITPFSQRPIVTIDSLNILPVGANAFSGAAVRIVHDDVLAVALFELVPPLPTVDVEVQVVEVFQIGLLRLASFHDWRNQRVELRQRFSANALGRVSPSGSAQHRKSAICDRPTLPWLGHAAFASRDV